MKKLKIYSGLDSIPRGHASGAIIPGVMVLEGGAWRGIYTQGALDAFMQEGINMQTTIGVSAGAMGGFSYTAGQIGRSARINLHYRHHPDYYGAGAFKRDHGITGFTFVFKEAEQEEPLDRETFFDPRRRFVAVATNIETGRSEYFDQHTCSDIFKAIQASATVPYVSRPVELDGKQYLDGGISSKIPMEWVEKEGFDKIVVIRTRDRSYRKPARKPNAIIRLEYHDYPNLMKDLLEEAPRYNTLLDQIDAMNDSGQAFVLYPSRPITIGRFEGDMEKLGALYWDGYNDAKAAVPALRKYLNME